MIIHYLTQKSFKGGVMDGQAGMDAGSSHRTRLRMAADQKSVTESFGENDRLDNCNPITPRAQSNVM